MKRVSAESLSQPRSEFGKKAALIFSVALLAFFLSACDETQNASGSAGRPTPSIENIIPTNDLSILYDRGGQKIEVQGVELYQNSSQNHINPFIIKVSQEAFTEFVTKMIERGSIPQGTRVRFVIHIPGHPNGSHIVCEDNSVVRIVSLELAREIYEHVYLPFFNGRDLKDSAVRQEFINAAQNQANLVLFHEGTHVRHCIDGVDSDAAERAAQAAEATLAETLDPVIWFEIPSDFNLDDWIIYIESLRR